MLSAKNLIASAAILAATALSYLAASSISADYSLIESLLLQSSDSLRDALRLSDSLLPLSLSSELAESKLSLSLLLKA